MVWSALSAAPLAAAASSAATEPPAPQTFEFPAKFAFGTATAAYQIEGAYQEGGRGLTIWDAFTHSPGKVRTGETGDVAADHYHRWQSDVRLMGQMKLKYYRFSIAWSRIFPTGYGAVNEEGVRFYNKLIDELIDQGIHPVATLYHWDLCAARTAQSRLLPHNAPTPLLAPSRTPQTARVAARARRLAQRDDRERLRAVRGAVLCALRRPRQALAHL